jgi:branched-chain amino acid transport system substrate-binding protein
MIIAFTYQTALIAQRTHVIGWDVPLFSSPGAQIQPVVELGGKAVEGMEFVQNFDLNSRSPAFLDFKARYHERFGDPTTFGGLGYETVEVLATGLKKTGGKREGLREALLETKEFKGLSDTFSFDDDGGVMRTSYIAAIRDGKAVTADVIKPREGKR